jgi:hypothetical protein
VRLKRKATRYSKGTGAKYSLQYSGSKICAQPRFKFQPYHKSHNTESCQSENKHSVEHDRDKRRSKLISGMNDFELHDSVLRKSYDAPQ